MVALEVMINADDGDRIAVQSYQCSVDEPDFVVSLRLENCLRGAMDTYDWITLSGDQARKFARAILAAADGVTVPDEILGTTEVDSYG